MSKKNDTAATDKTFDLFERLLQSGDFAELRMDRPIYKAEACGDAVLCGYLIDSLEMPPVDMGKGKEPRPWSALLIEVTRQPTKALDREGNIIDVPVGDVVIIASTDQLERVVATHARDPHVMREVLIQPKGKKDLGGGKTFWEYRAAFAKASVERTLPQHQISTKAPSDKILPEASSVFDPKTGATTSVSAS